MRTRVYIAGPLALPDREQNVKNAVEAMCRLIASGYAPFCPHLTHYVDPDDTVFGDVSVWHEVDLAWVAASDVVLRLPGYSVGADLEVSEANTRGIPVYLSLERLFNEVRPHRPVNLPDRVDLSHI